jgi:diadenosine tetraphosphate (Ap4A) HIT family hydrolase
VSKVVVDAKARRRPLDLADYVSRSQRGPCFVCEIVAGNPEYRHHVVYEDDATIAFLNKYPTLYGYTLVAPKEHREQVTGDLTLEEYLKLQSVLYRVAEAVRQVVPTERLYLLSLGSQQGNRHVHWHVAPLPHGVPYEAQQLEALSFEQGVLDLSQDEMEALAARIREALASHAHGESD